MTNERRKKKSMKILRSAIYSLEGLLSNAFRSF